MIDTLTMRRLSAEDLQTRVAWFNDSNVRANMSLQGTITMDSTREWFAGLQSNTSRVDLAFLQSGDLVAMGGLLHIDTVNRHAEMYIVVKPGLTGRGIGRLAIQMMANLCFSSLELNRLYLYTLDHNEVARHLYMKIGFVHEGILRQEAYHQGRYVDRHVLSMLRSEWSAMQWKHDSRQMEDV